MPKIDLSAVTERKGAGYPAPFDAPCAERIRQRLGEAGGLSDFGVNYMRLPPGGWSSQRHWHSHEDEFVFVVEGELVLIENGGETLLRAGDSAAFPKNSGDGHHLVNRSTAMAIYLEVGSRQREDVTTCSDIDVMSTNADGRFTRKDGTAYPTAESNRIAIDIGFDFRTDSGGKDPDQYSATLRRYHQRLWSKPLPDGRPFSLSTSTADHYLRHRSGVGEFLLASDSIVPTFTRWTRPHIRQMLEAFPEQEHESFRTVGYTIGGMIVFPANKIGGSMTINGARGFQARISDRFDLTLECIRRHYIGEASPLADTLSRYHAFFELFTDFAGYVDFFLLQDLVADKGCAVSFFLPFDNFASTAVPANPASYADYRRRSIAFVTARNQRIATYCAETS